MKAYELKVENVGEDVYSLLSRGHHDIHNFMQRIREDGYDWPLGMPEHVWMRTVPAPNSDFMYRYVEAQPYSRGAFPCTCVSEAYGEDRYEQVIQNRGRR